MWSELGFTKQKGKTLPQVLFSDPDWFFWAISQGLFDKSSPDIRKQAKDLDRKARNIRIPSIDGQPKEVEHYLHYPTMKYAYFIVVPPDKPGHQGSSSTLRDSVIDMSVPRRFGKYDKTGNRLMLKSLKSVLFGKARLTKDKAEAFFSDDDNFEI